MKNNGEKNLHEGHRKRMKKRFIENNFIGFSPHEVLEFMLFFAIPRANTNEIAHELLNRFGSINEVIKSAPQELKQIKGLGDRSVLLLSALYHFQNYCNMPDVKHVSLKTADARCKYFSSLMCGYRDEIVVAAGLDDECRLLGFKTFGSGTPGNVSIDVREMIAYVVSLHCNCLVIAHNHPRGPAVSSYEDIETTKRLVNILKMLDIVLIDHIIVGQDGVLSMQKSNCISF